MLYPSSHGVQRRDAAAGPIVEQSQDPTRASGPLMRAHPAAARTIGGFIGIDVGENFLDLAILDAPPRTLVFKRVALDRLNGNACATLAERIKEAVPGLDTAREHTG